MAQRVNYWSCSKFANWVRGTEKLHSGTSAEWSQWKKAAKAAHNFRYWLAEDFLDKVQDFIHWPTDKVKDFRYYCVNRFGDKMHYLPTRLKPGQYNEVGTRILHGLFETLVDFVEIESAWMHVCWDKEAQKNFPGIYRPWYLRWKRGRSAGAGIAHLNWAISLGKESPYQAKAAQQILDLYTWWKVTRPARKDTWETSGLRPFWNQMEAKYSDDMMWLLSDKMTPEENAEYKRLHDLECAVEEAYDKEDEKMLINLVKLRNDLWT